MKDSTQLVAFRLPKRLIRRLDQHAKRLEPSAHEWSAGRVTRSDAVRELLLRALEQAESDETD